MAKYQGHRSWAAWSVSLWINNEEGLYRLAKHYARKAQNRDEAAQFMLEDLQQGGITHTPDGAKYSKNTIKLAMRGM
mgnify:CR=1 FL=1